MKAIVYTEYGPPTVLRLEEVPQPQPSGNELLIKIYAAATNPLDWHFMRGTPYLMRLMSGFFRPKVQTLGVDFAGQVVAVGKDVISHLPGDRVFGALSSGAFAEYALAEDTSPIVKIPQGVSWQEAAAVPVAAVTALQGLRDSCQLEKNHKLLINGASGGVGTFAVQLALYYGADVTAVCSTRNMERVRSLGARNVLDYTRVDFSATGEKYDRILDLVGNRSVKDLRKALRAGGRCVICGFSSTGLLFRHMVLGPITSLWSGRKVGIMPTAKPNKEDFSILAQLLASGQLKPVIDSRYTLSEVPEAIRYQESGRARGKLIINIPGEV